MIKETPFEYHADKLGVKLSFLISSCKDKKAHPSSLAFMKYRSLKKRLDSKTCAEQQLRCAHLNAPALVAWDSLSQDWKNKLIEAFGEPKSQVRKSWFSQQYEYDAKAYEFYRTYGYEPGETPLSEDLRTKYALQASVLNTVTLVLRYRTSKVKALNSKLVDKWGALHREVMAFDEVDHGLVFTSAESFRKRYTAYVKEGYANLISGKRNNTNRLAIKGDVADWLLATYCLPIKISVPALIKKYNEVRELKGWKAVKERAVNAWLETPEIKRIWVLARHGRDEYAKIYGHRISRDRSQWFPNAYWVIDGSKLDWIHYWDNELKMAAKLKINPVIDVYSEKVIGWSYSQTENHVDHFSAIKMAVNHAQTRPYLIQYDNQSGHKSSRMQELYSSLVAKDGGTHYPTRPNEKSNPAEQVFGRFQQQVINQMWFSDKQSVKSREADSRPNMDFVNANKHKLYTKDFLLKAWEYCVTQWNGEYHPAFKTQTRNQVYQHEMAMSERIEILDMINLFWVEETKGSRYRREGISIEVGNTTYTYEVYDSDNRIDIEFRRKYVGAKLIVRYDPEQLDQYVQLVEVTPTGEKIHVANAQPKRAHESIPALMADGDKSRFIEDFKVRDEEYQRDLTDYEALVRRTGISREKMIEEQDLLIKMGGDLNKNLRNDLESSLSLSRL